MTTLALQPVFADLGITQADACRATKCSRSALSRLITHGEWPARGAAELRRNLIDYLKARGADMAQLRHLVLHPVLHPAKKAAPSAPTPEAISATEPSNPETEEPMLLTCESLSPAARQAFNLTRSPFVDDIQSLDDVFVNPGIRYVRAAMLDAAINRGFIAVMGESGCGKSTLREDLEERIRVERRQINIIKPYVIGLEPNDTRGKAMKSSQIGETIVRTLAPTATLRTSPDGRYRQCHDLLRASSAAGYSNLLIIEEAHRLPLATLKHLKNFMELKDGLRRLLGVCLIGQPELRNLLNENNPEIREIVQRCEQITLGPLDNDLESYLAHKFGRVGIKLADVFAPDAVDAIRARLIHIPRGGKATDARSLCYPLVTGNLVTRALNAAAEVGMTQVDAQVIAGC